MLRAAAAAAALLPVVALRRRTWSPRRMVNILWLCGVGVVCCEDRAARAHEKWSERRASRSTQLGKQMQDKRTAPTTSLPALLSC
jgi:hypothetical protein